MNHSIENDFLRVCAKTSGAELTRITSKLTGVDYLHDANPDSWGYHSPVLFPIIGRLKSGGFLLNGHRYAIDKHGFARRAEFRLLESADTSMAFGLRSTRDTKLVYPFDFELRISYSLCRSELSVAYTVKNSGAEMYFSIGAHPAFKCPLERGEAFSDYYLEFEKPERAQVIPVTADGFLSRNRREYLADESIISLDYRLFENDALVFEHLESKTVTLRSRRHLKSVTVDFREFPYLGVWTLKSAPFVCIEPWHGLADFEDFNADFPVKPGIITLPANNTFTCTHRIIVSEGGSSPDGQ